MYSLWYKSRGLHKILASHTITAIDCQLFKEDNFFVIKGGHLFLSTIIGTKGVYVSDGKFILLQNIRNVKVIATNQDNKIILGVGCRYMKIHNDGTISFTFFRKFASILDVILHKCIECESCICSNGWENIMKFLLK
jgi:hypothetical protein